MIIPAMVATMINISLNLLKQARRQSGSLEDAFISVFLVLFGGLMSGLTLGLMSLDLVELEVLQRSGSPKEQKQAAAILPVVKKQHQLLVTLLLCNAMAMEALPVFLDNMFSTLVAVVLSVTFVLAFGEIIPQAICSRYGLAIGANLGWLVRVLMLVCFPVAFPVGKLLDSMLGHSDTGLFRRAQLKAFVSIHAKEEGKGGELSLDETTIINGALDLTSKTAVQAMTPIESTFSIDLDSKLDWEALGKILVTGHSRVPVYVHDRKNLIGIILVKSLLTVYAEEEIPVRSIPIRAIPRVPADMPLYDILNQFQKGQSHMAAVVRRPKGTSASQLPCEIKSNSSADAQECKEKEDYLHSGPVCQVVVDSDQPEIYPDTGNENLPGGQVRIQETNRNMDSSEDGEVLGIITLEDVFEELIQEEIVDETDEYVDVHKRIRVGTGDDNSPQTRSIGVIAKEKPQPSAAPRGQPSAANTGNKVNKFSCFRKTCSGIAEPLLDRG